MKTRLPRLALVAVAVVSTAMTTTGCGKGDQAAASSNATSTLRYQGWSNTVTLPELAEDLGYLGDVKLKWVGNTISGPQDIRAAQSGAVDFGGAFDGAVAQLITRRAKVKAVVSYYGSDEHAFNGFYVLDGSKIKSAKDLISKKIGVNTLGGHNEGVTYTFLSKQGLSADEIKKVQLVPLPPPNTDQALRAHQIDVAALSGQFREQAVAKGGIHSVFTDSQFFGNFSAGTFVFRDDFIKSNPKAVRAFVTGIAKAIEWTKSTPHDQVIAEYTKIINKRGRNESTASLPYWHSTGVATKGGVVQDSDFTRWEDWLVSKGALHKGQLKASDYYTNEFNPFASEAGAKS